MPLPQAFRKLDMLPYDKQLDGDAGVQLLQSFQYVGKAFDEVLCASASDCKAVMCNLQSRFAFPWVKILEEAVFYAKWNVINAVPVRRKGAGPDIVFCELGRNDNIGIDAR